MIVFDFDGVLADTLEDMLQITRTVCTELGCPCEPSAADLDALENMSFAELGKQLGVPADKVSEFVERTFRLFIARPAPPRIFPGMREVVIKLAPISRIGILTGNNSAVVNRFIEFHNLSSYIDRVFAEDAPGTRPEKLGRLVSILGKPESKAYLVSDAVSDIRAARQASVTSIAVTWGHQSEPKLLRENPGHLVRSPQELLQVLLEHAGGQEVNPNGQRDIIEP